MLQLLFPPSCLLCDRPLRLTRHPRLCPVCRQDMAPCEPPHCSRCLLPFSNNSQDVHRCASCLQPGHFRRLYAWGLYEKGLADLIKQLKFRRVLAAAPTLGELLTEINALQKAVWTYDSIVPVPLHSTTLRRRGFNQAVLIGRCLAKRYRIKMERRGLHKLRLTATQSALTAPERRKNVRDAFAATRSFHGESCLLIDDVFTTGATAEACAAALRAAGAVTVDVLTVARAV